MHASHQGGCEVTFAVGTHHRVAALLPGLAADEARKGQLLVIGVRLLRPLLLVRVPALRSPQRLGLLLRLPLLRQSWAGLKAGRQTSDSTGMA